MTPDEEETTRVMEGWGLRRGINPTLGDHYGWSGMATVEGQERWVTVMPIPDPHSEYDDDVAYCASFPTKLYSVDTHTRVRVVASDPVSAMAALTLGVK